MQVLQHGARGVVGTEHGTSQPKHRVRLAGTSGRKGRAPGGDVDDARHAHRHQDEQQQREQVAGFLDGQGVHRRGEEPVQAQARRGGGQHRRAESADDRNGHDGQEVDQQVVGEVQVVLQSGEREASARVSVTIATATPSRRRRPSTAETRSVRDGRRGSPLASSGTTTSSSVIPNPRDVAPTPIPITAAVTRTMAESATGRWWAVSTAYGARAKEMLVIQAIAATAAVVAGRETHAADAATISAQPARTPVGREAARSGRPRPPPGRARRADAAGSTRCAGQPVQRASFGVHQLEDTPGTAGNPRFSRASLRPPAQVLTRR